MAASHWGVQSTTMFLVSLLKFVLCVIVPSGLIFVTKDQINLKLMRFFRDLSRFKSRKRLYGNKAALIPLLMGKEEPIDFNLLNKDNDGEGFTLTLDNLKEFDGTSEYTPIYLAVQDLQKKQGIIFDVTASRKLYGKDGPYHVMAGRDASRALATGCTKEECAIGSLDGLTEAELKEIDRWLELYRASDKYSVVGTLISDVAEELAKAEILSSTETDHA